LKKNNYIKLIKTLKEEILSSRYNAAKLVNRELLFLYFKVGKIISETTEQKGYGAKVIDSISKDLQANLPGLRGFSSTNLKYMKLFYEKYSNFQIRQSLTDEFKNSSKKAIRQSLTDESFSLIIRDTEASSPKKTSALTATFFEKFTSISFTHHCKIISAAKSWDEQLFYIIQSAINNWSVRALEYHLETNYYKKKGKLQNNFKNHLPKQIQEKAIQAFKDEYLLDFINIQDPNEIDERVVEQSIVNNIKQFLLSLGREFAFMGNQFKITVDGEEFFIDLLFYHRTLKALVAFELKSGKFKPEYEGKMSFYLQALNKEIKLDDENPSIGIILCKEKNKTIVEYSISNSKSPIGISTYKITNKLPAKFKKHLPEAQQLVSIVNEPQQIYVTTKN
jgi:predicted nuclease of restriction endonuclease-like (RecB) superfamily